MQKRHFATGFMVLFALASVGFVGCVPDTAGPGSTSIGAGCPLIDDLQRFPQFDAGPIAQFPPSQPMTGLPTSDPSNGRCGGLVCAAGETCCPSTGECHPALCADCCPPPVPAPAFPGFVASTEEPTRPLPGGAAEPPLPTIPTEGPGPGPDPGRGPD